MLVLASMLRSSDIDTAGLTASERRLLRSAHSDLVALADTAQAEAAAARLQPLLEPPRSPIGRSGLSR